jgi:hypothetical protein
MKEKEKRIKFLRDPVFTDGCERFTFIHIETVSSHKIIWALTEKDRESHTELLRLAIEEGIIPEGIEPRAGGVFNARTGEFERVSYQYKDLDPEILAAIDRKLPDLINCT